MNKHIVALNDTCICVLLAFTFIVRRFFFIFSFGVVAIFSHSLPRFLIFALCSFLLNSFVREKKKNEQANTLNVDRLHVNVLCDHCHRIICNFCWAQVNGACISVQCSAVQWIHFVPSLCVRLWAWVSECVWACLIVHLVHTNVHWKNCHSNQRALCLLFKHCTDLYVSLPIFLCIALTAEKQHCIEQCVCVHETVKHVNKIQKKLLEYSQRWTNLWETILHACHLIHNDQHIICTQTLIQEKKLLIERNG